MHLIFILYEFLFSNVMFLITNCITLCEILSATYTTFIVQLHRRYVEKTRSDLSEAKVFSLYYIYSYKYIQIYIFTFSLAAFVSNICESIIFISQFNYLNAV